MKDMTSIPTMRANGWLSMRNIKTILFILFFFVSSAGAFGDISHPYNMSGYVQPNSSFVRELAGQLYVDTDGTAKYITNNSIWRIPYMWDTWQFDRADYWQSAYTYWKNNLTGDCEDRAIFLMSMMLSGNMSIVQNYTLTKVKIPVAMYLGTAGRATDAWVQYSLYNKTFASTVGPNLTIYQDLEYDFGYFKPELVYHFGDKTFHSLKSEPNSNSVPTPMPTPSWPRYMSVD